MSWSWLPNAISIMRIILILPILVLFVNNEFGWALVLFGIAGLSDGIDGWLAKTYGWQSRLGGFLDPAGDKLLVAWSFGTLAYLGHIPVWLAVIVILRDVIIVAGSFLYTVIFRKIRLEWFVSWGDFFNHAVGAVLMGLGGVLAMGCTIGQGIAGLSTLALGSMVTIVAIIAGSALTMKYQYYRMMRE